MKILYGRRAGEEAWHDINLTKPMFTHCGLLWENMIETQYGGDTPTPRCANCVSGESWRKTARAILEGGETLERRRQELDAEMRADPQERIAALERDLEAEKAERGHAEHGEDQANERANALEEKLERLERENAALREALGASISTLELVSMAFPEGHTTHAALAKARKALQPATEHSER